MHACTTYVHVDVCAASANAMYFTRASVLSIAIRYYIYDYALTPYQRELKKYADDLISVNINNRPKSLLLLTYIILCS